METVEVVIRIPKEKYDVIMETGNCGLSHNERAIKHGTVLPKGHGRLIDGDKLIRPEIQPFLYHLENGDTAIPEIDILHAPTVIEADKGVSE